MTNEDIREYRKNAVEILRKHDQYATAKAVEEAFMALSCLGQYMCELDIAISQLEELGLSFGQKIDGAYIPNEEYKDRMIRATRKSDVTQQDLIDTFNENGLIGVYNLGLKNMLDYLNGN